MFKHVHNVMMASLPRELDVFNCTVCMGKPGDPLSTLRRCKELLNEGGYIAVWCLTSESGFAD